MELIQQRDPIVPLRKQAVGRRNDLFAGSRKGAERLAVGCTLVLTGSLASRPATIAST